MIQPEQKADLSLRKLKQGYRKLGIGSNDHHNDAGEDIDSESTEEISSESSSTSYEGPMKNPYCPGCSDELFPMKNVQLYPHLHNDVDSSDENGIL